MQVTSSSISPEAVQVSPLLAAQAALRAELTYHPSDETFAAVEGLCVTAASVGLTDAAGIHAAVSGALQELGVTADPRQAALLSRYAAAAARDFAPVEPHSEALDDVEEEDSPQPSDLLRRLHRAHAGAEALLAELQPGTAFGAALAARFDMALADAEQVAAATIRRLLDQPLSAHKLADPESPFAISQEEFSTWLKAGAAAERVRAAGLYPAKEPQPEPPPAGAAPLPAEHRPLDLTGYAGPPVAADVDEPLSVSTSLALPRVPVEELTQVPGLVGEMIDWMEATAELPCRALYVPAALGWVSALVGRKWQTETDLRSNEYFVSLAPSGYGKNHGIERVAKLAEDAGLEGFLGPGRFMSSSAVRSLLKRSQAVVCYMDEFASLMRQIMDRRAGIHNQLIKTDLLDFFTASNRSWAGAEYAQSPAEKVYRPNLSICGTSTPEDFWSAVGSLAEEDGLLARMILINVTERPTARDRVADLFTTPPELIEASRRLADVKHAGGNLVGVAGKAPATKIVPLTEGARRADGEMKVRIAEALGSADRRLHSIIGRVREHAHRMALTVAVGADSVDPKIDTPVLQWAYALAMTSAGSLVEEAGDRIADSEREANFNKVLRLIKAAGRGGITLGKITDRTRGLDQRGRLGILDDLQLTGRVVRKRETSKAGQVLDRYCATAQA